MGSDEQEQEEMGTVMPLIPIKKARATVMDQNRILRWFKYVGFYFCLVTRIFNPFPIRLCRSRNCFCAFDG